MQNRILLVDDEPNVLSGLSRQLHRYYEIATAVSGPEGLALIEEGPPFAVVVSDMRMPGMNGAAFLKKVYEQSPDTVRVLLTGYADLESAIAAVNEGNIFRFLTKPCPAYLLVKALEDAVKQHHLITAEHILLEKTLHGSIKTLTDILSLANPLIFSRASRTKRIVGDIADSMGLPDRWVLEIAAMLSQIACITLPPKTADKYYFGKALDEDEKSMVDRLPTITKQLLDNIPRLEPIEKLLSQLNLEDPPLEAQILKIALDCDLLETKGYALSAAVHEIQSNQTHYDKAVYQHFLKVAMRATSIKELFLRDIHSGMVFAENVQAADGRLLVSRGQEVTIGLLERLSNFSKNGGITEPLKMIC